VARRPCGERSRHITVTAAASLPAVTDKGHCRRSPGHARAAILGRVGAAVRLGRGVLAHRPIVRRHRDPRRPARQLFTRAPQPRDMSGVGVWCAGRTPAVWRAMPACHLPDTAHRGHARTRRTPGTRTRGRRVVCGWPAQSGGAEMPCCLRPSPPPPRGANFWHHEGAIFWHRPARPAAVHGQVLLVGICAVTRSPTTRHRPLAGRPTVRWRQDCPSLDVPTVSDAGKPLQSPSPHGAELVREEAASTAHVPNASS
jgi:hypothetical protein